MIRAKEICTKKVKRFVKMIIQIYNKKGWYCLNIIQKLKTKVCRIIYIQRPFIWDQLVFNVDMTFKFCKLFFRALLILNNIFTFNIIGLTRILKCLKSWQPDQQTDRSKLELDNTVVKESIRSYI